MNEGNNVVNNMLGNNNECEECDRKYTKQNAKVTGMNVCRNCYNAFQQGLI